MLTVYLRIAGQSNEIMAGYAPDMEHAESIRDIAVGSYAARGIAIQSTRIAGEPADKPLTDNTKE